ncbi:hypothetical protein HYH02_007473 [Chlamydomonas schloesseri]|uniref:EF-hand domain-containing protein n=1 Tax=Chlamydomonas schloesseri TaxID=2026947 RepID=A0A836B538_9CHLO|nr:hypothetical protein HYH02_007473 [Chlamydomonas schloesseri]|eukprot:KAG2447549.1 hypothetical protein HYH02_007473 [Chlamydomonas schloesseri]
MVRKVEVKKAVPKPKEMTWDHVEELANDGQEYREGINKLTNEDLGRVKTALHMLGKDEPESGFKTDPEQRAPQALEHKMYNKATMDRGDLVAFLFIMGVSATEDALQAELRYLKLTSQMITPAQAVFVWMEMKDDEKDEDAILKRAFMFFDKDGNGEISGQELRQAMGDVGNMLTGAEIDEFMDLMDRNGDGVVGYNEFFEALTKQTDLGQVLNDVKKLENDIMTMFKST